MRDNLEELAAPDPREPCPYGIGSDLWPGVGKSIEEQAELATVFGKLQGSGGQRNHWSGDLVEMMRDEIADVQAALDFLIEANPVLNGGPPAYIIRRRNWKVALFRAWHSGLPKEEWPQPEDYGLPPRPASLRSIAQERSAKTPD